MCFSRKTLFVLAALALVESGCANRSVGGIGEGDGGGLTVDGSLPDGEVKRPDGAPVVDAGPPQCGEEPLKMGFVVSTDVEPFNPEPNVEDRVFTGELIYKGGLTEPLAASMDFDSELQFRDGGDGVHILQYHLPWILDLHLELGQQYSVTFRERWSSEGRTVGLVIKSLINNSWRYEIIADTGIGGRAFSEEDPAIYPLAVYAEKKSDCMMGAHDECGGTLWRDALLFDNLQKEHRTVRNHQGEGDVLRIYEQEYLVANLASSRVEPDCTDTPATRYSYLALRPPDDGFECLVDRVLTWGMWHGGFEVNQHCDEFYFCADDPEFMAAAREAAPAVRCSPAEGYHSCGPDGYACQWMGSLPYAYRVGEEVYYEACLVTQLLPPGEYISCVIWTTWPPD